MERQRLPIEQAIEKSRRELGDAALFAASRGAIGGHAAKALNLHLGVTNPDQVLKPGYRHRKAEFLEEVAESVRLRRIHMERHRPIAMTGRLAETTMLALAVGVRDGEPIDRADLLDHVLTKTVSERRGIDPNIIVDQFVINDLRWLGVSTRPKTARR